VPSVLADFRRNSRLGAKRWPNKLARAKGISCILAASKQLAQYLSVYFRVVPKIATNMVIFVGISNSRGNIFKRFAANLLWHRVNKRPIKCAKSIA